MGAYPNPHIWVGSRRLASPSHKETGSDLTVYPLFPMQRQKMCPVGQIVEADGELLDGLKSYTHP